MDRAVIMGTFEFAGFHFCTKLLEKGIEIVGIHQSGSGNDDYLTHKRLAIGRNANFHEVTLEQWLPIANITEKTLFIIDYYDYFIQNKTEFFNKHNLIEDFFRRKVKEIKETQSCIIMLLPIQWAASTDKGNQFIQLIQSHRIYLPTLYGPWQPKTFLFQQALLKNLQKVDQLSLNEREWTDDAIYIDDAVLTSLKLIDNPAGAYILKSDMNDQWQKCAQNLSIPLNEFTFNKRATDINNRDFCIKVVKSERLISERIEEQKKYLRFLLKG